MKFSQANLEKVIRTVKEAGLPITDIKVGPQGEIDVRCGPHEPADEFDATDMRR
ncbi:hypothetical protein [Paracoccus simplex]|uniref:Uncharacterized protein n=1 Tax=Paracoccus simplex TaxID=2086346 RepID=A0ABV7S4W7_9RHOB